VLLAQTFSDPQALGVPLNRRLVLKLQEETGKGLGKHLKDDGDVRFVHIELVVFALSILLPQEQEETLLDVQRRKTEDLLRQESLLGQ
jgi:hypothetical protein